MKETQVQADEKNASVCEPIDIVHNDTHHTHDISLWHTIHCATLEDIERMIACVKNDIRDRKFDATAIVRLFVAVCASDVQCRNIIKEFVRWAPLPSDSKQLYYMVDDKKFDLLERDWRCSN